MLAPLAQPVGATGARLTEMLSLQLFDLIYREETLFNVIKSVTRNGRSILLTALLALILVYLFSIVGFLFLKDDFILEVDRLPGNHSRGLGDFLSGVGVWGDNGHAQVTGGSTRQGVLIPPGSLPSSCWILGRSSLHQPASPCMTTVRRVGRALAAFGLICICHSCRPSCLCDGLCVSQQGQERPPRTD